MLNKARVQMELPSKGHVWLFINPSVTIAQFKDMCVAEDPKISNVEIQDGAQPLSPDTNLLDLLQDSKKTLKLRLNDTEFKFGNAAKHGSLDTTALAASKWHDLAAKEGLGGLHATTLGTILTLTEQNLDFSKATGADVTKAFEGQAQYFENAVVREEIYKLNTLRISTLNELEALRERKAQIEK